MIEPYDSRNETIDHIHTVQSFMNKAIHQIKTQALFHDGSKLKEPEKSIFDKVTPKLKSLTYGSDEYKQSLEDLKPALAHHYENNSHHPEHHARGVLDMDMFELIEMLCDWKAATLRHDNGDFEESMKINKTRFSISDDLFIQLKRTAEKLGLNND